MHLNEEDVIKLLKLIEESNFVSMYLECGDLKLKVCKSGYFSGQSVLEQQNLSAKVTAIAKTDEVSKHVPEQKNDTPSKRNNQVEEDGLIAIKAPMVGTFYCAPEPGAKPFVDVSSGFNIKVERDTIVGLIETMKVFNSVVAGVKGTIIRQLVEDSQFVEYNQPLFLVRPEEEQDK